MPSRVSVNDYAFDVASPERDYWVGMLMADGCILERGNVSQIRLGLQNSDR